MYKAGDKVFYQPRGKGTRKKKALIKEVREDGCYQAIIEGKFYHIREEHITGYISKRRVV